MICGEGYGAYFYFRRDKQGLVYGVAGRSIVTVPHIQCRRILLQDALFGCPAYRR